MIKNTFTLLIIILSAYIISPLSLSADLKERPHGDKTKLPKGCASCHKGHGMFNTSMLSAKKETFCFRCHGGSIEVERTKNEGALAHSAHVLDIQAQFEKPYRHPVGKTGVHRFGETLPETDPSLPRHAECGDCHHHHLVTDSNKMSAMRGTDKHGAPSRNIESEYELCFNCHSYSANRPVDQTNKAEILNTSNASFHPVLAAGKNRDVPSLLQPLNTASTIKCTDCHNNDNPQGPKGPHGSIYKHILSRNFVETDGQEGSFQYELCYGCHRRNSILGNQSFYYHDLHISKVGVSCRTCHNPHGSTMNAHLIDFNNMEIRHSSGGQLSYLDLGPRQGRCELTCHDKDHNPATYPPGLSGQQSSSSTSRSSSGVSKPSFYPSSAVKKTKRK